ncbi:MAG: hypothetical protein ACP5L5_09710 [Vulcanisaeta sp.]|uniref:hypothetical protein n=1 Tax=Vulcanisaeta sp. TaxID=2020871 RepID=UPI003D0C055E
MSTVKPTNTRHLMLIIILTLGIASIALTILAQTPTRPKPFMTINGQAYQINYYSTTSTATPTIIINGYIDGTPVPFSVSLFAITPTKIYTVGYYYGTGTVSINLTNPLMTKVAETWISECESNAGMPSLMTFITYENNNETWTVIMAIPYSPNWIIKKTPIRISISAEFDKVKPVYVTPIKSNNQTNIQTTQINQANGNNDPYGFTYVGNCSSSFYVAPPPIFARFLLGTSAM